MGSLGWQKVEVRKMYNFCNLQLNSTKINLEIMFRSDVNKVRFNGIAGSNTNEEFSSLTDLML